MKKLLDHDFEYVQDIMPVRDRNGCIQTFFPQEKYKCDSKHILHQYGDGAFCRFSINPTIWSRVSGVYAFFIDSNLVYIGQALDLAQRFNQGYGYIAPRACFEGGETTNCKMNKVVLETVSSGKVVSLYFCTTGDFHRIERDLIEYYNPTYNSALRTDKEKHRFISTHHEGNADSMRSNVRKNGITNNPPIQEVRAYIQKLIELAKTQGKHELTIRSGEIHSALNMISALPTVCSAMRTLPGAYKYMVVDQPPKGNGSWLVFKYIF